MSEKKRDAGIGGYLAIGVIGIVIGRWSVVPVDQVPTAVTKPSSSVVRPMLSQPYATADTASFAPDQSPEETPVADTSSVYYARCADARAAGAAPIHEGEPGYAPHLDRDGDGIACE